MYRGNQRSRNDRLQEKEWEEGDSCDEFRPSRYVYGAYTEEWNTETGLVEG